MIQVKNLDKYYNKKKSNEIHVINDISLDFPETGLVCLLGSSGSGKTTLLNVIGGLDKVDKGKIIIDDFTMNKYSSRKWDLIRNYHFGYIFQNYILLPELTVYQNLEFVLKMLNLNKEEIDKRIDYALNAVGMLRFKNRKPGQLSGGQQQRVAIARALVKSPSIVIADEPTGNLDEKNSTVVMNIIKKISQECLVILVTHEKRLADFYADQIIELKDGKVKNQTIVNNKDILNNLYDNNIYLQEYEKEEFENQDVNIKYFFSDIKPRVELNVIINDNVVYIHSNQDNLKIKFINQSSEVKVIDSKKPIINQEHVEKFEYQLPKLTINNHRKTMLGFKDTLKLAIKNLTGLKRKQKALFVIFFLTAIMVIFAITNFISSTQANEKEFMKDNRNIVEIQDCKYPNFNNIKKEFETEYLLAPYNSLTINRFQLNIFKQSQGEIKFPNNTLLPIEVVNKPKLVLGILPTKVGEVVIDKWLVDKMLNNNVYLTYGISGYENFIGLEYFDVDLSISGKIVGIVDTKNPNFYCTYQEYKLAFINLGTNMSIIDDKMEDIDFYYRPNSSRPVYIDDLKLEDDEVLVSTRYLNEKLETKPIGMHEYRIVGFYVSEGLDDFILSEEAVNRVQEDLISGTGIFSVYSLDKKETIKRAEKLGYEGIDVYLEEQQKSETTKQNQNAIYLIAVVILIASFVFLFYIMRTNIISRIYEVGVYRALGVKKTNIYKLFFFEIIIITILTAGTGVILFSQLMNELNSVQTIIYYPQYVGYLSLVFILITNIIIGMIPIITLLRITPSQILSKYDI